MSLMLCRRREGHPSDGHLLVAADGVEMLRPAHLFESTATVALFDGSLIPQRDVQHDEGRSGAEGGDEQGIRWEDGRLAVARLHDGEEVVEKVEIVGTYRRALRGSTDHPRAQ